MRYIETILIGFYWITFERAIIIPQKWYILNSWKDNKPYAQMLNAIYSTHFAFVF